MSFIAGRRMKTSDGKILEPGDPVPGAEDWQPRILGEKIAAGILIESGAAAMATTEEEAGEPKKKKKKTKKKS